MLPTSVTSEKAEIQSAQLLPDSENVKGQWTYQDYLDLPDNGRRYEIIEGVLYTEAVPGSARQFAVKG